MTEQDDPIKEFALENFKLNPLSSAEAINQKLTGDENAEDDISPKAAASSAVNAVEIETDEAEEAATANPIFKELSAPKLPTLAREDRARLQLQTPNRIHFYWSFKQNPFQTLNRVVGKNTNYQLIIKLVNQTNEREEFFPADTEGSAWFDVDADSTYRAEIGFYAVSRPFVRLMFSNRLQTPRKNPSSRQDYSERFAVSADQFAKVLDVSGFSQDAFEVALAGDDIESADQATETAFAQIFDQPETAFDRNKSSEMRFVLLALASGYALADLRGQINPSLFTFLQNHSEKLSAEKALTALQENFGVSATEQMDETEESFGAAVFGASLINFPRSSKRRPLPKFAPLSSLR